MDLRKHISAHEFNFTLSDIYFSSTAKRGEEQNREEGEMAQTKLGGGRNREKK